MSDVNGKYAPIPGKIPGIEVNMSGVKLTFAPLTLDMVQEFEPKMRGLNGKHEDGSSKTVKENIEDAMPVLLASLNRNYPDLTVEQLRVLVDVGNFGEAIDAISNVSGYKRLPPGESLPAGR